MPKTETLPPVSLTESSDRVKVHATAIEKIETDAQRKTLLPRLLIGLHCLKAHTMFALVDASKRNAKGRNQHAKKAITTELAVHSYEAWLAETDTNLKKTNTYRYMTAVKGLGCDEHTTEDQLTTIFKTYTNPTLSALCLAATDPVEPQTEEPQPQLEFDLLRDCLKATRQQCEELIATKARIQEFPELHTAACGRIYQTLYELTGMHWAPSDEAHDYANINPDQIEL